MIRDVINVFENLVNSVQCVGAFIGESLYWMPISVEEGQGTVLCPFLQKNCTVVSGTVNTKRINYERNMNT